MIPNTFIIGAMKSATTSLCAHLVEHPDVVMVSPKEPDFFSRDEVYAKGIRWYESLFKSGDQFKVVVDGSTSYTKQLQYPLAASRLAKQVPSAKLIYIVRHPVERMQSHWAHEVLKGRTTLGVDEFVRTHPEVVDISSYWKQLNVYRDLFDDQQILLLFAEDLRNHPVETLSRCTHFLDLPEFNLNGTSNGLNQTSKRQLDVFPIRILRGQRWFDVRFEKLKQSIPARLHPALKIIFKSRKKIESSALAQNTVGWAIDQLGDDPQQILIYGNKSSKFWNLESTQPATNK